MPRGQATRVLTALTARIARGYALAFAALSVPAVPVTADSGVEWHAPAECPSAAQAAEEIARLRAPGPSAAVPAHVEIRRESARNLQARVSIRAQGQPREQLLRDADCTALTRAAALVVAMAAEPESPATRDKTPRSTPPTAGTTLASDATPTKSRTTPPSAAGATGLQASATTVADAGGSQAATVTSRPLAATPKSASASTAPDEKAETAPRSDEERVVLPVPLPERRIASPKSRVTLTARPSAAGPRDRAEPADAADDVGDAHALRAIVSAAVGASAGIVPNLAPSALVSVGVLMRDVHAAVRFGYVPRQHAWLTAGAGGHVALASAAAEGGYRLHLRALEVPLFAGLEGGVFSADANGVEEHSPGNEAWLAAFAGSGLGVTWDRLLGVALRAEGVVALRRPSFALATADGAQRWVFHRPSTFGTRVYLSLELQFL